jgi:hypothetical protein
MNRVARFVLSNTSEAALVVTVELWQVGTFGGCER